MAGLASKDQVGVIQDLSDLIIIADMRDTPVLSMLPKSDAPTDFNQFTWQFESYNAPDIGGRLSDQDRTTFDNHTNRAPLSGRCQIWEQAPKVGRIAANVNKVAGVGVKKEFSRAVSKALTVAKRSIECTILSGREGRQESGEDAALMRGMFVTPQAGLQTDAACLVPAVAQTPTEAVFTGAYAAITEDLIRDVMLRALWEESGRSDTFQLIVGSELKSLINSWMIFDDTHVSSTSTPVRRFDASADEDEITLKACVGAIQGDYGTVEITPSPWLRFDIADGTAANTTKRRRSGIGFEPDMHALRFAQMPQFRQFEDKGGGPRGLIEAIGGREDRNPKRMLVIAPSS